MKYQRSLTTTIGIVLGVGPAIAHAQNLQLIPQDVLDNPQSVTAGTLLGILTGFGKTAVQFVFAVVLIFLILTGYLFITSLGDEAKMKQAKTSILYLVIGVTVVLSAYLVIRFVAGQFTQNIPGLS